MCLTSGSWTAGLGKGNKSAEEEAKCPCSFGEMRQNKEAEGPALAGAAGPGSAPGTRRTPRELSLAVLSEILFINFTAWSQTALVAPNQIRVQSDVQSTVTPHAAACTPHAAAFTPHAAALLFGNQPSVFYFINCATVPRPLPLSSGARSPFDPGNCFLYVENWLRRPWRCTVKQKYWARSGSARARLQSSKIKKKPIISGALK